MGTIALLSASMSTLACVATSGLCFLVGLRDAGANKGSLGGLAKSLAIGVTFAALIWGWALFVVYAQTT